MTRPDPVLTRLRKICLSLPDTEETITWGEPHFRVAGKIFCGYGTERGRPAVGFKLERAHAALIIDDRRFWRAPYVGHAGWVSMDPTGVKDWDVVADLIQESYELIAPKRSLARLGTPRPPQREKKSKTRTTGKKTRTRANKKSAEKNGKQAKRKAARKKK